MSPYFRKLILTYLQILIPCGYYGRIAPRSGLLLNNCIDIAGVVFDTDYLGKCRDLSLIHI